MTYPVLISIISISIIFIATLLGSAFVFFFKGSISPRMRTIILGFAGGIMVSASFFGLIMPSIEQSQSISAYSGWEFISPIVGFILGCFVLYLLDKLVPHFHKLSNTEEGLGSRSLSANSKFFLAVTIHNIPEGLSVGFACGIALALSGDAATTAAAAALSLAIGIAIQNVPEGAAVSIPMHSDGMSKGKSFLFGAFSGIVEPLAAIIGLFLAQLSVISPWLLAFAAGAMIYVTLDEIIPESRETGFTHTAMFSFIAGFVIMMALEIIL